MPKNGNGSVQLPQGMPPELEQMLLAAMAETAASRRSTIVSDDDIAYHDGTPILLPGSPDRMPLERAREMMDAKIREQEETHGFSRRFNYRPEDGANATANVLAKMFGLVVGKAEAGGFFSPGQPPRYLTIDVAHNRKREVPWGQIIIPALPGAVLELAAMSGPFGPVYGVTVEAPKKHKDAIIAFFDAIDEELRANSIYRGRALQGAHSLKFLNLDSFDSSRIVFADEVEATLDAALYSVLRYPDAFAKAGMSFRRALLLYGPFGTGKSSIGQILGKLAPQYGTTFLNAQAGRDKLRDVLETAKLYQPAIVFIEDIDAHTPKASDRDAVSELLDIFDGIAAKDTNIILVATTNHIESVPAGMLRPGRMDYVIPIEGLDRNGTERLIRAVVPVDLLGRVNFDQVYAVMERFQPAWVKATADRAQSFALARAGGNLDYTLSTADLVAAARSLRAQLDLMEAATEGERDSDLDGALYSLFREAASGMQFVDSDGDPMYALKAPQD